MRLRPELLIGRIPKAGRQAGAAVDEHAVAVENKAWSQFQKLTEIIKLKS